MLGNIRVIMYIRLSSRKGMICTLMLAFLNLQDAGVEINITDKEPFIELHRILEALKRRDLQPALR